MTILRATVNRTFHKGRTIDDYLCGVDEIDIRRFSNVIHHTFAATEHMAAEIGHCQCSGSHLATTNFNGCMAGVRSTGKNRIQFSFGMAALVSSVHTGKFTHRSQVATTIDIALHPDILTIPGIHQHLGVACHHTVIDETVATHTTAEDTAMDLIGGLCIQVITTYDTVLKINYR